MMMQASKTDHILVWYAAADGSFAQSNAMWEGFTGQSPPACEGWGWLDAVHPDDRVAVRQLWDRAEATAIQLIGFGVRLRRRDGEYRQLSAQAAPVLSNNKLEQWVVFATDTTTSLETQQAVKAGEARLRLLDEIGQATRTLQDADRIMAVTARLLGQAMGATRCAYADVEDDSDRFTIRSDWAIDGVPSSAGAYSLDLFGSKATANLRQGLHLVIADVDEELGDDDGGRMFNAIGIKAIICAGLVKEGRLVAMMAVHQAVPRQWSADEVELVSTVVDRCWAHIERTRDAAVLREQDARKDEFIATLAHELRNPLAPIKYAVALASRQPIPEPVAAKLTVIDRQVSLMAKLIDDLLDVSRINRGLIELQRRDVALDELVAVAVEGAQALLDKQGHGLHVHVPHGIQVHADPERMVQVIGNLLTNAAKYTPAGGTVEVTASASAGKMVLAIRDNGLGMTSADQSRLFTMFTQLAHTKSFAQGGLGLGLALVKKLVELHGGTVHASSPGLGKGSSFSVELAVVEPAPLQATAQGEALEESGSAPGALADGVGGERVLVVEDNDDGRHTLVELLRGMEWDVADARSGPEALDAVERRMPDLILLDLGLPEMDGYHVARTLRERYPPDRLTIVALSGWSTAHDRARTRAAGFDEHLAKPVEPSVLIRTLRTLLGRARPVSI